jgi:hypothetical protein
LTDDAKRAPSMQRLDWRAKLKRNSWIDALWTQYKSRKQERTIREDDRQYRVRAATLGVPAELPEQTLRDRLRERYAARGFNARATAKPHIGYATPLDEWERHNIPPALRSVGRLTPFYLRDHGFDDRSPDWTSTRGALDEALLAFVRETHARDPIDVFVAYLSGYHITAATVRAIGALGIPTCAYWWDDRLYFRGYTRGGRYTGAHDLAAAYDLNLTNSSTSIIKYLVEGGLAMFWPEGANPAHFRPLPESSFKYDVSFIGQRYGRRPAFIRGLRQRGLRVQTFGPGWDEGPITAEEMVEVYASSRVNLGISGIGYSIREMCLKGRDFEVPMCGAVYVTGDQPDLGRVYEKGKEIFAYRDVADCAKIIHRLLSNPADCEASRASARVRCLRDHTWERRFRRAFDVLGVMSEGGTL